MSARTFADLYKTIVGPKLRRMCKIQGTFVMLADTCFADAIHEITGEACRLGATHLPEKLFQQLLEQIGEWLLLEINLAQRIYDDCSARHHEHILG